MSDLNPIKFNPIEFNPINTEYLQLTLPFIVLDQTKAVYRGERVNCLS